ncbi:MAG: Flp pilus assembly complex ATPase component TadA [Pirellulales bacterium]|nr:Flp pilus assembly complex ATPase component TadA [Pirellulales bacterium]
MRRAAWLLLVAIVVLALAPAVASAANPRWDDWYDGGIDKMPRGPGWYLSWVKIVVSWLWFLIWATTSDWVNIDCQRHRFNYALWNSLCVFPFAAAFVVAWWIPFYAIGLLLMAVAHLVPLFAYVRYRNLRVEMHQKVLTAAHLRFLASERLAPLGIKIAAERRRPQDEISLKLIPQGAPTERDNSANLLRARQSPGFVPAVELLNDALVRRSDAMMLDYTAQGVSLRYEIDGLWQNGDAREREQGDALLVVLKTIAALNPGERRARQQGKFGVEIKKRKFTVSMTAQGTQTGERVLVQFDEGGAKYKKLPDLGMREKLVEEVRTQLSQPAGIVLLSAPPRGGLSALTSATLGSCDRFVRVFVSVDDVAKPEPPVENITVTTYNAAAGETPLTVLPALVRQYPDVLVVRDFVNADVVHYLCDQVQQQRMIISTVRAKDAVEAPLRVLQLKASPAKFASVLTTVINMRLVRKLCEACREPYAPPPQLLQRLRIPAGKVENFYRPPQQPEKVCQVCGGVGYVGRTGIFEVLSMNDALREVLAKTPRLDLLRQEARKQGFRGLQEEGILLVAKGVTSLEELRRTLEEPKKQNA